MNLSVLIITTYLSFIEVEALLEHLFQVLVASILADLTSSVAVRTFAVVLAASFLVASFLVASSVATFLVASSVAVLADHTSSVADRTFEAVLAALASAGSAVQLHLLAQTLVLRAM